MEPMQAHQTRSYPAGLAPNLTPGSQISPLPDGGWRLEIPAGPAGKYRLAQLDDYGSQARHRFPHRPPFSLRVRARASAQALPGTWGFGLWNNPFGMAILSGAELLRLPALPNTAWFFWGSAPNYLSLREDVPGRGWMAGTFRSPRLPPALLALAAPGLPLLLLRPLARLLRRLGRGIVRQSGARLDVDVTAWHTYELDWQPGRARFGVDGQAVLETQLAPHPPLGLVIWIDNQFAALEPDGRLGFGTLPNHEPAWFEFEPLSSSSAFINR